MFNVSSGVHCALGSVWHLIDYENVQKGIKVERKQEVYLRLRLYTFIVRSIIYLAVLMSAFK
jgi:hypothetical protein